MDYNTYNILGSAGMNIDLHTLRYEQAVVRAQVSQMGAQHRANMPTDIEKLARAVYELDQKLGRITALLEPKPIKELKEVTNRLDT